MSTSAELYPEIIPSRTLLQVPKKTVAAVVERQFRPLHTRNTRPESSAHVYIVEKIQKSHRDLNTTYAVKLMRIREPDDLKDAAYRELRILMYLKLLMEQKKCVNFVYLEDWSKCIPPLASFERSDANVQGLQYLLAILQYAQTDLLGLKQCSMYDFKCILFQLLWALFVAGAELHFVHNDLHLKNILVQQTAPDQPYTGYHDKDDMWYTQGYRVKITDFGHARLAVRETGEVVYNHKDTYTELYHKDTDLNKLQSVLHSISIFNTTPQDRFLYRHLKKAMGTELLEKLLRHPFFDQLRMRPEGITQYQVVLVSSSGDISTAKAALAPDQPGIKGSVTDMYSRTGLSSTSSSPSSSSSSSTSSPSPSSSSSSSASSSQPEAEGSSVSDDFADSPISSPTRPGNGIKQQQARRELDELPESVRKALRQAIERWESTHFAAADYWKEHVQRPHSSPIRIPPPLPATPKKKKRRLPLSFEQRQKHLRARLSKGDLFKGYTFVFTGYMPENGEKWQSSEATALYEIGKLVTAEGGAVVDSVSTFFTRANESPDLTKWVLVADRPVQTPKFLLAVLMGVTRVHHNWLLHSRHRHRLLPAGPYFLPVGFSLTLNTHIYRPPVASSRPFCVGGRETRVEVLMPEVGDKAEKRQTQQDWEVVLRAAGALPVQRLLLGNEGSIEYVLCWDSPESAKSAYALSLRKILLSMEWVAQCIIHDAVLAHSLPAYAIGHKFEPLLDPVDPSVPRPYDFPLPEPPEGEEYVQAEGEQEGEEGEEEYEEGEEGEAEDEGVDGEQGEYEEGMQEQADGMEVEHMEATHEHFDSYVKVESLGLPPTLAWTLPLV